MPNGHHGNWNTSKPPTASSWQSSQHQQTSLPAAQAQVAQAQAAATQGYDPGHKSESDQPQYNKHYVSSPGTEYGNEFGGWEGSSAQAAAVSQAEKDKKAKLDLAEELRHRQEERERTGDTYKPWQETKKEQFASAFGGLGLYGENNDEYAWNPFQTVREDGSLRNLTWDEMNTMLDWGVYDTGPIGNYSGWPDRGGGGNYGYGYGYGGGGGGGGGGYGYGADEDPMARGYQRGKVGPGGLLEAVNQLYFRLSGMSKKRGGIIGLLRL